MRPILGPLAPDRCFGNINMLVTDGKQGAYAPSHSNMLRIKSSSIDIGHTLFNFSPVRDYTAGWSMARGGSPQ